MTYIAAISNKKTRLVQYDFTEYANLALSVDTTAIICEYIIDVKNMDMQANDSYEVKVWGTAVKNTAAINNFGVPARYGIQLNGYGGGFQAIYAEAGIDILPAYTPYDPNFQDLSLADSTGWVAYYRVTKIDNSVNEYFVRTSSMAKEEMEDRQNSTIRENAIGTPFDLKSNHKIFVRFRTSSGNTGDVDPGIIKVQGMTVTLIKA